MVMNFDIRNDEFGKEPKKPQKIYIVEKNTDFTEGRGPMVLHSVWEDCTDAINFVENQQGIFGSPQYIEFDKYGYFVWANGYTIKEVEIMPKGTDYQSIINAGKREAARAKLTDEEKKLLGIM